MEQQLEKAHARFCGGDGEAFAVIAACLLRWRPPRAKWPGDVEEHLVQESIEDALLAYWAEPGMFDVGRGVPLPCFLGQVALRKLATRICKKRRRRRREQTGLGKEFWQKTEVARTVGPQGENDTIEEDRARLERLLGGLTPCEREGVQLLCRGVRATEAWARIVGVEGRPIAEQRREVHNAKVRLLRKLRRLARGGWES